MPPYIIKAPSRDAYVMWSTVVAHPESPVLTRREMHDWCSGIGIPNPETWLARADDLGTSDTSGRQEQFFQFEVDPPSGEAGALFSGYIPNTDVIPVWEAVLSLTQSLTAGYLDVKGRIYGSQRQ